jgi:hypothetical protein
VVVPIIALEVVQLWLALHWRIGNVVGHHSYVGLYEEQIQGKRNNSPLYMQFEGCFGDCENHFLSFL